MPAKWWKAGNLSPALQPSVRAGLAIAERLPPDINPAT
ncbi:hypothetical protein BOO71_0005563 [Deinococcus marmoris]|uniref:Uncharacterized protein n=1 Tax=Deinococcus marmoris TaxID=249408 RepID=A0A1U7NZY1_9DEIO|nr:hypothetical protein BOO71_0005563 [Deinococcus marmoris]